MKTFQDDLKRRLKDEDFKKEYEAIQPEMEIIRALIKARKEQNITQKDLALITGINQADISKLENGNRNPTLNMLKKLADGLGMTLRLEFEPKQKQHA
ncbi:MAG: helix-turn-helix transcriptional regulator [Lachnospiraceae bacterium]|nr:helix-turn-helix transcriptional regulator [Lachnospiraceae bacterium]